MNIKRYIFLLPVFLFDASTALANPNNPANKLISTEAIKLVQPEKSDVANPLELSDTPIAGITQIHSSIPSSLLNLTDVPKISQLVTSPPLLSCPPREQTSKTTATKEILINKIEVSLSKQQTKIISEHDVKNIFQQLNFKNLPANLERLCAIKDAITLRYIELGYITSRAKSVEIKNDGTVTVSIIEGRIGDVKITDYEENPIEDSRQKSYINSRVKLGIGTPLNIRKLEEQIRLLEIDSVFDEDDSLCKKTQPLQSQYLCSQKNVDAILRPSEREKQVPEKELIFAESDLIIKVKKARSFRSNFSFDNSFPPSVGAERLKADLSIANLARFGDIFVTSFQVDPFHFSSEDGFNAVSFGYQIPRSYFSGDALQSRTWILEKSWVKKVMKFVQRTY